MDARGYDGIPSELCYWITFLSKALLPQGQSAPSSSY